MTVTLGECKKVSGTKTELNSSGTKIPAELKNCSGTKIGGEPLGDGDPRRVQKGHSGTKIKGPSRTKSITNGI